MKRLLGLLTLIIILISAISLTATVAFAEVSLTDGEHEEWIDRIDLSGAQYAIDFNNWLTANSDIEAIANGGSSELIDPTLADVIPNGEYGQSYVYKIVSFEGESSFSYVEGDEDGNGARAQAAISSEINTNFKTVSDYITAVYNAFDRDRPEIFWLSGGSNTTSNCTLSYNSDGKVTYEQSIYFLLKGHTDDGEFDIRASDYISPEVTVSTLKRVFLNPDGESLVDKVISGVDQSASRAIKVRYFNDWLIKNNCYNGSSDLSNLDHDCREATSALTGLPGDNPEAPVCEAYARALKVLCDKVGIPCVLVNGDAGTGASKEAHMWNCVQMENGEWYAVDVTWNDPVTSGVSSVESGNECESYLLVGSNTLIGSKRFSTSHTVTNQAVLNGLCYVNEPVISTTAYEIPSVTLPVALRVGDVNIVLGGTVQNFDIPGVSYNATTNTLIVSDGAIIEGTSSNGYAMECSGDINVVIEDHAIIKGYGSTPAFRVISGELTVINSSDFLLRTSEEGELTRIESASINSSYFEIVRKKHLSAVGSGDGVHSVRCTDGDCPLYLSDESHACLGGNVTCESLAVCELCQNSYGELAEHGFTEKDEASRYLKSDTDCLHNNEYWYACSVCGEASDTLYYTGETYGSHNFEERIEDDAHYIEGSGDCHSKKKYYLDCTLCDTVSGDAFDGTEYGDHKVDKKSWVADGTEHFHKCTVEGCDYTEDKAACTGGSASCVAKAKCEVCRQEYGSLSDHTYSAQCDSTCNSCQAERIAGEHYDGNENYVCDNCKAIYIEKAVTDIFGIDAKIVLIIFALVIVLMIILKIIISVKKEKRKARKYREKMERKREIKRMKAERKSKNKKD